MKYSRPKNSIKIGPIKMLEEHANFNLVINNLDKHIKFWGISVLNVGKLYVQTLFWNSLSQKGKNSFKNSLVEHPYSNTSKVFINSHKKCRSSFPYKPLWWTEGEDENNMFPERRFHE
jgi:hypothetical protein